MGFDISDCIVNQKDAEEYNCCICLLILENAVEILCCGTLYCKECIDDYFLSCGKKCMFCSKRITSYPSYIKSTYTQRKIDNVAVTCRNIGNADQLLQDKESKNALIKSCSRVQTLKDLSIHLGDCPLRSIQCKQCDI
eukprot:Pgem_evm1s19566